MSMEIETIFNSTMCATAIATIFEIGLFDALHENDTVNVKDFCDLHNVRYTPVFSLLQVLEGFDIVNSSDPSILSKGQAFSEAYSSKGYFLWLINGYGNMWQNLPGLVKNEHDNGDLMLRNGKYIAQAGRDYGAQFVDSYFRELLAEVPFKVAADLGCGSAERLRQLANNNPDFVGIGIDINPGAIKLARQSVETANLQDRIMVVHDDISHLAHQPKFSEVEVIFCFFMGHDLWPRSNCIRTFRRIREVFPQAKRFLLSDTYRSDLPPSPKTPIFTLGFEVSHAVMDQYIPSVAEWMEVFSESGWACVNQRDIGIPFSTIFDLR